MESDEIHEEGLIGNAPGYEEFTSSVASSEAAMDIEHAALSMPEYYCDRSLRIMGVQAGTPLAWSDDGKHLAYVSGNSSIVVSAYRRREPPADGGAARVPPIDTWETVSVLNGHHARVSVLLFKKDSNIIVSCGAEGIFVWDYAKSEVVSRIPTSSSEDAHDSPIESACFVCSCATLVTGARSGDIKFWDALAGYEMLETVVVHKAPIMALAHYQPKAMLASSGRDSSIRFHNVKSMSEEMRKVRQEDKSIFVSPIGNGVDGAHKGDVTALEWSHDGAFLFSGARDNSIKIWDFASQKQVRVIDAHMGDIHRVITLNNTKILISGARDGDVKVWKVAPLTPVAGSSISFEDDGISGDEVLAQILSENSEGNDGVVEEALIDVDGTVSQVDELIACHGMSEDVLNMEINAALPFLAISSSTHDVRIYNIRDLRNPKLVHEFLGHNKAVTGLEMIKKDTQLLSVSDDFLCALSDCETMQRIMRWTMDASISEVAVSPDESMMFLACNDYAITVFKLSPGPGCFSPIRICVGHAGRVNAMDCFSNGKKVVIASAGLDFDILLWSLRVDLASSINERPDRQNLPKTKPASRTSAHDGQIHALRFNEDASLLASGGSDHMLAVFSVNGSKKLSKFWKKEKAHVSLISSVAWGKGESSHLLASGSWDGVTKLWHVSRKRSLNREINVYYGHESKITSLDFSMDGAYLFSASSDCTIRQWSTSGDFQCFCVFSATQGERGFRCIDVGKNSFASGSENGVVRVWPLMIDTYSSFFEKFNEKIHVISNKSSTPAATDSQYSSDTETVGDGDDAVVIEDMGDEGKLYG